MKKKKHWYEYLWIWAILYFALGFFNILFAWFGMIDFLVPLGIAIFGGNKFFCNHLCGRGQLFSKLGGDLKCSRTVPIWLFDIFPYNVWKYGISDIFSWCRSILLA